MDKQANDRGKDDRPVCQINESGNGTQISLARGRMVEVSLPENRTTGYRWHLLSCAEPVFGLVDDHFQAGPSGPGAGGTHRWRFAAVQPGHGTITLASRRPWEQAEAARTFNLHVTVQS